MLLIYSNILAILLLSHQIKSEEVDFSNEYFGFASECFVKRERRVDLLYPNYVTDIESELDCMNLCLQDNNCLMGSHDWLYEECTLSRDGAFEGEEYDKLEHFVRKDLCAGLIKQEGCLLFSLYGYIFDRPAYKSIASIQTYTDCTNLCLNESQCLSGMYYHAEERCLLNTGSASTDPKLFKKQRDFIRPQFRDAVVTYFQKKVQCHNESEALQIDEECFKITPEAFGETHSLWRESGVKMYSDCTNICLSDEDCVSGIYNPKEQSCNIFHRYYSSDHRTKVENGSIGFEKIVDCFSNDYVVRSSGCFNRTDNIGVSGSIKRSYVFDRYERSYLDCTNRCLADDKCLSGNYRFHTRSCSLMVDSAMTLAHNPDAFYVEDANDTTWKMWSETYFEKQDHCFQHACSNLKYGYIFDVPPYHQEKVNAYWKCSRCCTKDDKCLSAVYYPKYHLCQLNNQSGTTLPETFIKNTSGLVVMYFEKTPECVQVLEQEQKQWKAKGENEMGECFENFELHDDWAHEFKIIYGIECYYDCTNRCLMDENCFWGVSIVDRDGPQCWLNNERYDYRWHMSISFTRMRRYDPEVSITPFKKKSKCFENVEIVEDCLIETEHSNLTVGELYRNLSIESDFECVTRCLNEITCAFAIYSHDSRACEHWEIPSLEHSKVIMKTANNSYFEKKEQCFEAQWIHEDCFQRADGYNFVGAYRTVSETWAKHYADCTRLCLNNEICVSGYYLGRSLSNNCILHGKKATRYRYHIHHQSQDSIYFEKMEGCSGQRQDNVTEIELSPTDKKETTSKAAEEEVEQKGKNGDENTIQNATIHHNESMIITTDKIETMHNDTTAHNNTNKVGENLYDNEDKDSTSSARIVKVYIGMMSIQVLLPYIF